MKKLINRADGVVEEMLDGLVALHAGLARLPGHKVILRADAQEVRDRQVALISGGGSGHEPAHAGYVGQGMLSAAVAGDVFTSPSPDAVLAALRAVTGRAGALLLVKNYTGDRLNFGLAAELARAEGLQVEMVLVADDVALTDAPLPERGHPGRRGIAGTVLVHKVAGAAAAAGRPLGDVAAVARSAAAAVATMGVGLSSATVPAVGRPTFHLGEDEMELGLGIHGEPGVRRAPIMDATAVTEQLLGTILRSTTLGRGDRVALLINNLGGTTTMELAIVARQALLVLEREGLVVERAYAGTFLTALEMAGVSLSLLQVDDARLAALDAPTEAPAWPRLSAGALGRPQPPTAWRGALGQGLPAIPGHAPSLTPPVIAPSTPPSTSPITPIGRALERGLLLCAEALVAAAPHLTRLDQAVGDGDLGISLERGMRALVHDLPTYPLDQPAQALRTAGFTLQRAIGGTSGPLYAVLLLRAAATLAGSRAEDPLAWAVAFEAGCNAVAELGGATSGDRTMLDALLPAAAALRAALAAQLDVSEALTACVEAAERGAEETERMLPRRGRSSYLGERVLGHRDPGAEAVAVWLRALLPLLGVRPATP
jgi:dihydroxyacetone kinase